MARYKLTGRLAGKTALVHGQFQFLKGVCDLGYLGSSENAVVAILQRDYPIEKVEEDARSNEEKVSKPTRRPKAKKPSGTDYLPQRKRASREATVDERLSDDVLGGGNLGPHSNGDDICEAGESGYREGRIRDRVRAAIRGLNPNDDDLWTPSGDPKLEAVCRACDMQDLTRTDVHEMASDLTRQNVGNGE